MSSDPTRVGLKPDAESIRRFYGFASDPTRVGLKQFILQQKT